MLGKINIALYCITQAVRHPRTPMFLGNPLPAVSPIPWWGSITVLILGIITWILSATLGIPEMAEPARAMVYLPLGNIFGMTWSVSKRI